MRLDKWKAVMESNKTKGTITTTRNWGIRKNEPTNCDPVLNQEVEVSKQKGEFLNWLLNEDIATLVKYKRG